MNKKLIITKHNLFKLLEALKDDYEVFVPVKKNEKRFYKKYEIADENIIIGEVRPFEPLKAFFTASRGKVADDFTANIPHADEKPYCIVGVKNCDLKGFQVQDFVFNDHDFEDPLYINKRKGNIIISADCTCAIETCFCRALGNEPYPERYFDLNLSEVGEHFVVEAGSEKGHGLLEKHSSLFEEAGEEHISRRKKEREKVIKEVEDNIKRNGVPPHTEYNDIIERNFESDIWADEVKTCVECGACTIICPSCHCFLLYDQKDKDKMARLRVWDSCMFKGYARVAGGANPRPKLWMRLRNRFYKKFDFFPKVANIFGCTGCGRCVSACPAKIDIRKVLKRLVNNA